MKILKSKFVLLLLKSLIAGAILFAGLKGIDWVLGRRYTPKCGLDMDMPSPTMRTLDWYPYEGWHLQAYSIHNGPMWWESTTWGKPTRVLAGQMGYFIDFDLNHPPEKQTNEFRIILTGGSGAQGWGGTMNEKMFYSVMERELQKSFPNKKVRVINLAMGASVCYQNFISLNLYAHGLKPDLIVAYVGRNDYEVPFQQNGLNWPLYADDLSAFVMASRGSECCPQARWLAWLMPNFMRKTAMGAGIKMGLGWDYYRKRGRDNYCRANGIAASPRVTTSPQSPQEILDRMATPQLVHALKSIKRDFDGIPIMVLWQGQGAEVVNDKLAPNFYDTMFDTVIASTKDFYNQEWFYLNMHAIGVKNAPPGEYSAFKTHLDDRGHDIAGRIGARAIGSVMPRLESGTQQRKANGLKDYGL